MSIRNSFFLFLMIFLFSVLTPSFSLSINLQNITYNDSGIINCTGSAYISNNGIQLTPNEFGVSQNSSSGRATYIDPLHLWDRASGNLADFTTQFSFVINSGEDDNCCGDGLTFFLAPATIQPWDWKLSQGSSLGIGNHQFVAVEFDTFKNLIDSNAAEHHVGIDINSMVSVKTTPWFNNISVGSRQNDASINYNSDTMMLSVDFTGYWNSTRSRHNFSYVADLRKYLPEKVTIGFSAATGDKSETHSIISWQFFSTSVASEAMHPIPHPSPRPKKMSVPRFKDQTGFIVGLSVGLPLVIFGVALASYCWWKKRYKKEKSSGDEEEEPIDPDMDMEFEKGSGAKKFSYSELVIATKNFAKKEKLGEGGFGGVYRGFLRDSDSYIAVKRISKRSKQGLKEYMSEVKIISQLRHRNLVQLIGWCHQRGELLLVYELMPNGSLDSHLFKSKSVLGWEVRYKIAQGLASALLYLHEGWEHCVLHRDIKSSNIMLDSSFNVKLGDFGLARLVDHEKGTQTTDLAGTLGYMAPECSITGQASKETDIYSFGIVLLEIACGRRPIEHRYQENKNQVIVLLEWVWSLYGNGMLIDAADPNLSNEFDERVMEQLVIVGLWCAHPDNNHRPSIRKAILVLNFEAPLPTLPRALPVLKYLGPTAFNSTDSSIYSGAVDLNKYSDCSGPSQST